MVRTLSLDGRQLSSVPEQRETAGVSPSYDPRPIRSGPTLMTSFHINYLLKSPVSNIVTLGGRAPTHEFWGNTVPSITG